MGTPPPQAPVGGLPGGLFPEDLPKGPPVSGLASARKYLCGLFGLDHKVRFVLVCTVTLY